MTSVVTSVVTSEAAGGLAAGLATQAAETTLKKLGVLPALRASWRAAHGDGPLSAAQAALLGLLGRHVDLLAAGTPQAAYAELTPVLALHAAQHVIVTRRMLQRHQKPAANRTILQEPSGASACPARQVARGHCATCSESTAACPRAARQATALVPRAGCDANLQPASLRER